MRQHLERFQHSESSGGLGTGGGGREEASTKQLVDEGHHLLAPAIIETNFVYSVGVDDHKVVVFGGSGHMTSLSGNVTKLNSKPQFLETTALKEGAVELLRCALIRLTRSR